MFDNSIVNETSPEANWNRQTGGQSGRQTGAQNYVLCQADALTKNIQEPVCKFLKTSQSYFWDFMIGLKELWPMVEFMFEV